MKLENLKYRNRGYVTNSVGYMSIHEAIDDCILKINIKDRAKNKIIDGYYFAYEIVKEIQKTYKGPVYARDVDIDIGGGLSINIGLDNRDTIRILVLKEDRNFDCFTIFTKKVIFNIIIIGVSKNDIPNIGCRSGDLIIVLRGLVGSDCRGNVVAIEDIVFSVSVSEIAQWVQVEMNDGEWDYIME